MFGILNEEGSVGLRSFFDTGVDVDPVPVVSSLLSAGLSS
jgi:hypothetical protein